MKNIIADTEHVAAIVQDLGDETVVIVFNPIGAARNGDRFWLDDVFLHHRISAIGIVASGTNFYPPASMKEVIPKVLSVVCGRRVITFGHNQGGYGALKFAQALGASVALAFGPIWSIGRKDVGGFDTRFLDSYDERLDNGSKIVSGDLGDRAFVFYEPRMPQEARHAEKILHLEKTAAIVCPFTNNETVRLFTEGKALVDLIRLCSNPSQPPSAREIRTLVRSERQRSEVYIFHVLSYLIDRAKIAPALLDAYVRRFPGPEGETASAVRAFLRQDFDGARARLKTVSEARLTGASLRNCWKLCEKFAFAPGGLLFADLILSNYPNSTGMCLEVISTLTRQGLHDRAAGELLKLADHDDIHRHLAGFVRRALDIQRPDIVEALLPKPIPRNAKLDALFSLANYYHEQRNRPMAVKLLREATPLCADSITDQLRLSHYLGLVEEWTVALALRRELAQKDPANTSLKLDIIWAKANITRDFTVTSGLLIELQTLTASAQLDAPLWDRVSHLYVVLKSVYDARTAIEHAVRLRPDNYRYRHRLVYVLKLMQKWPEVRAQLRKLLAEVKSDPHWLRVFGREALTSKNEKDLPKMHALARAFAEAQYVGHETDSTAILYLAEICRRTGDRSRALAPLTALFQAECREPKLSDAEWNSLAGELFETERSTMTKAALVEVLRRQPHNDIARKNLETILALERRGMLGHIAEAATKSRPRLRLRLFG